MEFIKSFLAVAYVRLIAIWMVLQCRVWTFYRMVLTKVLAFMKKQVDAKSPVSNIIASKVGLVEDEVKRVDAHMVENGCRGSSGGVGS